jgi:AcrR family transcriptional regulator
VRSAVLAATRRELATQGYAGLRLERVAALAGVHRSTMYRNWPSPSALAADVLGEWERSRIQAIDTGSWETDLRQLVRLGASVVDDEEGAAMLRMLVAADITDPALNAAVQDVWERDYSVMRLAVERAKANGSIRPEVDPKVVMEIIMGPIVSRVIVSGLPIDEPFLDALTSIVLVGTAAGGSPRRKGSGRKPKSG